MKPSSETDSMRTIFLIATPSPVDQASKDRPSQEHEEPEVDGGAGADDGDRDRQQEDERDEQRAKGEVGAEAFVRVP